VAPSTLKNRSRHASTPSLLHALQLSKQLDSMDVAGALELAGSAPELMQALGDTAGWEAASLQLLALSTFPAARARIISEVGECL